MYIFFILYTYLMAYGIAFTQAVYILIFVFDKVNQKTFQLVPTSVISEALNIPRPSVVKILQSLNQAGIIESGTGKSGGVRLTRSPQDISLEQVFSAIEGQKRLFRLDHTLNATGSRPEKAKQEIETALYRIETEMLTSLSQIKISHFIKSMDASI